MKDRNSKINILKGLGILSVVLGHVGFPYTNIVYLYHMGLFFFISGYLYKESCEKDISKYIVRKFKSLYIPFVIFEIIFVFTRNVFIDIGIYDPSTISRLVDIDDWLIPIKQIVTFNYTGDNMIGAIWFLRVLFYVSILYAIFNKIYKKIFKNENDYIKTLVVIFIVVVAYELMTRGYNPSTILNPNGDKISKIFIDLLDSRNLILMSIFYIGTLFKKYENRISINAYIAIISIVTLYYNTKLGGIDVSRYKFQGPIYFIMNSVLGIYLNIYIANIIYKTKLKFKIIEHAGKYSIYIMMLHLTACKILDVIIVKINEMNPYIISTYPVSFHGKGMWIIYTFVGIIFPLCIAMIVNMTKYNFHTKTGLKDRLIK